MADEPVDAIEQVVIDDLLSRHAGAGIEFRVTPSIWPFWRRVTSSSVEFSGSRLRNSAPHPDRFGSDRAVPRVGAGDGTATVDHRGFVTTREDLLVSRRDESGAPD